MWLAIGKFFSSVIKFVLGVLTAIVDWAREHPREALIVALGVALLVASNFWTHRWATEKAHAEDAQVIAALRNEVEKANEETDKRNKKIERIEKESKSSADTLEEALKTQKTEAQAIISDYKKKLAEEKKNYRVIYVKDKDGTEIPINVDPGGAIICDKFSQTFMDTVNRLVDNANKPLTLRMSPTLTK